MRDASGGEPGLNAGFHDDPSRQKHMQTTGERLSLTVLGCHITVWCVDAAARALLVANSGRLQGPMETPDLWYTVGRHPGSGAFFIAREGHPSLIASDAGEFLFLFEKDFTIELQKLRPELYFLHSAVLAFRGRALMLVGTSGSGKSTTTWALLHHGFGYLSDELGPLDLETLEVYPYPHALSLKNEPPKAYPLPAATLFTSRALYIPVEHLAVQVAPAPVPLAAIFFLRHRPDAAAPEIRSMSKAEAGARLFASTLNPLAHPGDGLDAAIEIAMRAPCFELITADLPETCARVEATMKGLLGD